MIDIFEPVGVISDLEASIVRGTWGYYRSGLYHMRLD